MTSQYLLEPIADLKPQVTLRSSDTIQIVPHLMHDGYTHDSLTNLAKAVGGRGYSGGLQLILVSP